MVAVLFILWISLLSSFSFSKEIPFALISAFGGAGHAGIHSAEYHTLNPAVVSYGSSRMTGLYFFNQTKSMYAISLIHTQQLPLGITWLWDKNQNQHYQMFSIAGRLDSKWWLGAGLEYFPSVQKRKLNNPHVGLLYQPISQITLGLTGSRIHQQIAVAGGFHYQCSKYCLFMGDVRYFQERWSLHGGMEWITKNAFSLRIGGKWPGFSYRAGLSLISFPVKIDYTWIQKEGHSVGVRVQSHY